MLNIFFFLYSLAERKERITGWKKEMNVFQKEHQSLNAQLESFDQVKAKNLKQAKAEVDKWTKALATGEKRYEAKKEVFAKMDMENKAKEAMLAGFLDVSKMISHCLKR